MVQAIRSSVLYEIIVQNIYGTDSITYTIETAAANSGNVLAKHVSLDGLGLPPVTRRFIDYPESDGGIDIGFHVEPRQLVWKMFVSAGNESDYDSARDELLHALAPWGNLVNDPFQIKITDAGGAVRYLDAYVNGPIDIQQSSQIGYSALITVPLYCPDPVFYTSTTNTSSTNITGGSPVVASIVYGGTWETWPIIRIIGEVADFRLELRITTAAGLRYYNIDFTGHTIASGRTYTVNLSPGAKTIVDDLGANRIPDLNEFSTLSQFRLFAPPIDSDIGGQNSMRIYYTSTSGSPRIEVDYVNRYITI